MSCLLLQGPAGSGKTFSLRSILQNPNAELFLIELDQGGDEVLKASLSEEQKTRYHAARIAPAKLSFLELALISKTINRSSYEDISNMKSGIETNRFTQFVELLTLCHNFKDDTGKEWGPVTNFSKNQIVALDNLSAVSDMALTLMVGARPNLSQGEYQVVMGHVYQFLTLFCNNIPSAIVLAHIEREVNELTGRNSVMASTVGRKLAPKIPKMFGDVVYAKKSVDGAGKPHFYWATIDNDADLKTRILPLSANMEPSFALWLKGLGISSNQPKENEPKVA